MSIVEFSYLAAAREVSRDIGSNASFPFRFASPLAS